MARVRRILMDLFHQPNNEPRREAPAFLDIVAERFEPTLGARGAETLRRRGPRAAASKAHARGIRLLKENLSPAQRDQHEKCGYFDVVGGETGTTYRIRTGSEMNVQKLDTRGRPVCLLCFVPRGELVVGDVMLAQKLALELFETEALDIANKFPSDHPLFNLIP
jgi:hypothetical protein